jgi:hypothetical protein
MLLPSAGLRVRPFANPKKTCDYQRRSENRRADAEQPRRMTESVANPSLVRNSLLLGKKQGISAISVSAESLAHRKCRVLSGIFLTIPYLMEQGILKPEQGILKTRTGNFPQTTGKSVPRSMKRSRQLIASIHLRATKLYFRASHRLLLAGNSAIGDMAMHAPCFTRRRRVFGSCTPFKEVSALRAHFTRPSGREARATFVGGSSAPEALDIIALPAELLARFSRDDSSASFTRDEWTAGLKTIQK